MKTKHEGILKAARFALFGALAAGLCSTSGCLSPRPPPPPPVSVSEILTLSKAGVPAPDIIRKIQTSGTVYRLPASELAQLKAQGVSDDVINYMQQTHLDAVRRDQGYYYAPPFGYWGYYYPYWWDFPGPIIVGNRHHHEFHQHHRFH